ncbi:uncharacterized protein LTR77_005087 [Saxophila tyrrhenica]|uniref:Sulfatase N-terminal domain-containing protein n=1 Tax=Saxophila tyrrhenica TaxID=1690608 RepID=A0AAV9PB94_9PEZI|nr:hypothetical protein LTR77_005087 [Saxophila tyrrhenica]
MASLRTFPVVQVVNTNDRAVGGPGGGYRKFLNSGQMSSYLPLWLSSAGYRTAYLGKFMNGLNSRVSSPTGWEWSDFLVSPFIYSFNRVVMRRDGGKSIEYRGWHQTDVLRLKALEVIEEWGGSDKRPFYLEIAPASPHVRPGGWPTVPLERHMGYFPGVGAPRMPNWNPVDELHQGKPGWVGKLERMNESVVEMVDASMRARLQGLQGVDEIVDDVVELLEKKGILDNTYIIYTTDNGFHLGQHRVTGGKGLPYISDVNIPFAIRGPGIPSNRVTSIPQTHVDIAPTLLDIAGLPQDKWPEFFDGRSLLPEWQAASDEEALSSGAAVHREVMNVEYWGSSNAPAGPYSQRHQENSYKSLRMIAQGGKQGWLFNRWCTSNFTELYDTVADPYELHNLAIDPDEETKKLMGRLSGLLLVTKSCGTDTCRRPWDVLAEAYRNSTAHDPKPALQISFGSKLFASLDQAMHPTYDDFFAQLPMPGFQFCLPLQLASNEGPYFPPESEDLGRKYRQKSMVEEDAEDRYYTTNGTLTVQSDADEYFGDSSQRHASVASLYASARQLSEEEMGWEVEIEGCDEPDSECWELYEDD